jgi:hypothetical protein
MGRAAERTEGVGSAMRREGSSDNAFKALLQFGPDPVTNIVH